MKESGSRREFINHLVNLEEEAVLSIVHQRIKHGDRPNDILEDAQEAMLLVGKRYEEKEYYVTGLMMAGEIFRQIMEIVEPVLVQTIEGDLTGHVLLGTIEGDIHDIGKNIFSTFLRCYGFTVTDIGVDVPPIVFKQQVNQLRPDIIGISGLLTTSYDVMKETIQLIRNSGDIKIARTPIIIGGGTLNSKICGIVGADYWSVDAYVGTQLCKQIIDEQARLGIVNKE